jgi:hypothetical protein
VAGSSKAFQRLLRIAAVPTAAFLVFAAVWSLDRWGGLSVTTGLQIAGGLGFPGFAAVSAAIAARRGRGRQRQAWLVMTFGLVALVFGAVTVLLYDRFFRGTVLPLYPPAAMIAFLLFPAVACIALLLFPSGYSGVGRFRMLLDGAIVGASLFVVAWMTLLRDAYPTAGVSRLDEFLSIACPVGGVVTVTVAVLGLARANAYWRRTLTVLTLGLSVMAVAGAPHLPLRHLPGSGLAGGTGAAGHRSPRLSDGCARDVAPATRIERAGLVMAAVHSAGCRGRPRGRQTTRKSGV